MEKDIEFDRLCRWWNVSYLLISRSNTFPCPSALSDGSQVEICSGFRSSLALRRIHAHAGVQERLPGKICMGLSYGKIR
jgi:hypothetical protein